MDHDESSAIESDISDDAPEHESPRPNRWNGAPSTWASYTEEERGLAASLDQVRNADLSIHLYNAHALKRRAREYDENPEEVKKEFPAIPDEDQTFRPPRSWTAWPIPPNQVPRTGESIGPVDPDEKYTFKRKEKSKPSRELEEVLLGTTLRFAKERFLAREEEPDEDSPQEPSASQVITIEEDESIEESESPDSSGEEQGVRIKQGSEPPPPTERLVPTVSLDDDRSRQILQPSIRHTLQKLDDVLMALHHARKTCRRHSYSSATSANSDYDSNTDREGSPSPQKRPKGRPRKFADLPDRSRAPSNPDEHEYSPDELFRGKKTHLGRPLKVYDRQENESQQDYLVRIARIQKKPLPPFAPPPEPTLDETPPSSPEKSHRSPRKRLPCEEVIARRSRKLNPRDWSDVMATAGLVGFPPNVIARATQRCADLFREGMSLRSIVETPFSEDVKDRVVRYVPEAIPDLGEVVESESEESEDSSSEDQDDVEQPDSLMDGESRVPPLRQKGFCPISSCLRREHGFRDGIALRRHIEVGHGIAREEVEDYILPSDEEMSGSVHVDGFLRPLENRGGRRGSYKKTAKRARPVESSDEDEEAQVSKAMSQAPSSVAVGVGEEEDDEEAGDYASAMSAPSS